MISDNFPVEMLNRINYYLPREDLAQMDQVNKSLHEITSAEYALYLSKVKLSTEVVSANVQILWNYPEGNFDASFNGKLKIIYKWNVLDRLYKWIRNFLWNGEVDQKVKNVAKVTLEEAYRLAVDNKKYLGAKCRGWSRWSDLIFNPSFMHSDIYPINEIACLLSRSNQFNSIEKKTYDLFKQEWTEYGTRTRFLGGCHTTPLRYKCHKEEDQDAKYFHNSRYKTRYNSEFYPGYDPKLYLDVF
ncbi:MAG TPA: F-box protein [Bacteroidia bacterium]|nr:F-box protein [Bacteroidia bacterium]